jgi:hypothetical protein
MVKTKWLIFIIFNLSIGFATEVNFFFKEKEEVVRGEFLGTYMNHIHVLVADKIKYFSCESIEDVKDDSGLPLSYDCDENTLSEEILFPPELDPMTGEWITNIPDVFNTTLLREKKQKEIEKKTIIQKKPKEGVDKLTKINPSLIESPSKEVVPKTNTLNLDFSGLDTKIDDVKKEESEKRYLTEKEIRVLVQDEIKKILENKHFIGKTKKGKRKPREGVYQRYYSGQITKKQFVKIVDGRSPVELLEINIISQQEYDEAIANPLSSLEYMQMFGPSITLKRKPEYLIVPGIAVYVFLYIIFAG